jgi:hypothetical protein
LLKAETAKLSSGANQGMTARVTPSDPELDQMEKDVSSRRDDNAPSEAYVVDEGDESRPDTAFLRRKRIEAISGRSLEELAERCPPCSLDSRNW